MPYGTDQTLWNSKCKVHGHAWRPKYGLAAGFFRHGSGVRWRRTKRPRTPLASRGRMHHRRTIGLNIPRQVASPQSPTPFLQAPLAYRSLGIGARSIGHRRDALKIRGSGARRQNSPEDTHRFCGGAELSGPLGRDRLRCRAGTGFQAGPERLTVQRITVWLEVPAGGAAGDDVQRVADGKGKSCRDAFNGQHGRRNNSTT